MRQPNPVQYGIAAITAYDGNTDHLVDALQRIDPQGEQVSDRYLITGLIGLAHDLADRLAQHRGTNRTQVIQSVALDLAERIEITGA